DAVLLSGADLPVAIVVVGARGSPEYDTNFLHQALLWSNLTQRAGARLVQIGVDSAGGRSELEELRQALAEQSRDSGAALWLVLIGHGTFDGAEARFNLRGPDLTAGDLAGMLKPFDRPLVVVNTASASAPFMAKLAGPSRIVITATRSGNEQNFTRFGLFFVESFADSSADLDCDGGVSLLEAFLAGSRRVAEFYRTEGRLATEHALLDDNGDGLGTQADWFRGIRAVKKPDGGLEVDGARAYHTHFVPQPEDAALPAELRARRQALELEVVRLRDAKGTMTEAEYFDRLEAVLLELANILKRGR
ncbi:MAG: hypothetical protein QHJ82_12555, partial [Verrucomicrobiota bacterium]|nr:hypothetical protein [Verrucomicrobiota bacterium]